MQDDRKEPTDDQLLSRFARNGDQQAFGQLFVRYRRMVLGACLREVRDSEMAEDCCTAVFMLLTERARKIDSNRLASWLFTTARLTARNARRAEERRMKTQHAYAGTVTASAQDNLDIHLNGAIARLREGDREALLLRFMQGLSYAEIGTRLGLGETGARMKVTRSVEVLKRHLGRAGCTVPLSGLEPYLEQQGAAGQIGELRALPKPSPHVQSLVHMAATSTGLIVKAVTAGVGALALVGLVAHGAASKRAASLAIAAPPKPVANGLVASVDRGDPKSVADAFAAAFYNANPRVAFLYILNPKPDVRTTWDLAHMGLEVKTTSKVKSVEAKGDEAIVTLSQTTWPPTEGLPAGPKDERLFMKRSQSQWFVSSKGHYDPRLFANPNAIHEIWSGTDVMVALIQSPKLRQANYDTAVMKESDCEENMLRYAQALNKFASHHDHIFAVTVDNWKSLVAADYEADVRETGREDRCPAGGTYSLNPNIAGKSQSDIKELGKTILVYEGHDGKLDFRHGGKAGVALASGQAKMVTAEEAASLRWAP